jgi:hypothetical protein
VAVEVIFSEDPERVLSEAGAYLGTEPVLHNLVLTLLHARRPPGARPVLAR